ncbi:NfeD family protein [Defluviimonas sp. SAOS-178_SWC]|uniref:NfeD family protein n=1 Tax=Defluviimonas sp. SAOS-178_SWC TaxID=3121287 RepID=UPI003221C319
MLFWQEWWVWMIAGAVLAILEIMIPGFILLGFAVGAALTGLLLWLGVLGGSLAALVLVFAVASLVAWLVLRRVVGVRHGQVKVWNRDINDN